MESQSKISAFGSQFSTIVFRFPFQASGSLTFSFQFLASDAPLNFRTTCILPCPGGGGDYENPALDTFSLTFSISSRAGCTILDPRTKAWWTPSLVEEQLTRQC